MSSKVTDTPNGETRSRGLKVIEIPIADVIIGPRLRPLTERAVAAIAPGVARDGVRQPIEVSKIADGWKLVSGLHRIEASRRAGRETIPAIQVRGTAGELRKLEISENLTRNELSALERCQFTAELKRLFLVEYPNAARGVAGGKARQGQQMPSLALAEWYGEIAARSERAIRTIKRQASVGENLDRAAADQLRETDFEDNQTELEALSKRPPEEQRRIAAMLADPNSPIASVRDALAALAGQPAEKPDSVERAINGMVDRWRSWPRTCRRAFVYALSDEEFAEMVELRRAGAGEAS